MPVRNVAFVGGGDGIGAVYEIAREVSKFAREGQLMIVAGRNQVLKQKLDAVDWEIPTKVFGFVKNMPDLMGASDILITKAGPGTISEALISRLPMRYLLTAWRLAFSRTWPGCFYCSILFWLV